MKGLIGIFSSYLRGTKQTTFLIHMINDDDQRREQLKYGAEC
jgi:hypothetical protein